MKKNKEISIKDKYHSSLKFFFHHSTYQKTMDKYLYIFHGEADFSCVKPWEDFLNMLKLKEIKSMFHC